MLGFKFIQDEIHLVDDNNKIVDIIANPAFLYNKVTGSIYKIGESAIVQQKFDQIVKQDFTGIIAADLVLFQFDLTQWDKKDVANEMDKLLNNTGYVSLFLKKYSL